MFSRSGTAGLPGERGHRADRLSRAGMTVRVLDGRSLGHAEADAWSEIQAAQAEFASPFFCPEFTMAMARARSDVRVAVMESGGEEVGFFPFHDLGDGTAEPAGGRASDYH